MFWKKVVILISFLFTAKRTLMMSSSPSRSGSRSRSSSRSRGPRRRRSPRSRSHSGSGVEGGSGQYARRGSSRSRFTMDRARKRRRSRSEDLDMPSRPKSNALVPVDTTRHAADESSDTSEDDDDRLVDVFVMHWQSSRLLRKHLFKRGNKMSAEGLRLTRNTDPADADVRRVFQQTSLRIF